MPRQMPWKKTAHKKPESLQKKTLNVGDFKDRLHEANLWMEKQHPEKVTIKGMDGLSLAGGLYINPNAKRIVLCVHGYRGDGKTAFSTILPFYLENGCSVLIIDQRAHGESEGKYITFGAKESEDVALWAKFLAKRFPGMPIFMDGVSMGAASVMMSTACGLPKEVCAVISDCGYTTPAEILAQVVKNSMGLSPALVLPLTSLVCRLRSGSGLWDVSAPRALAQCKLPILFLHGKDDTFVPTYMARQNYTAAAGEKRLVVVPDAGHAVSWLADTAGCEKILKDFLETYTPVNQEECK